MYLVAVDEEHMSNILHSPKHFSPDGKKGPIFQLPASNNMRGVRLDDRL